MTNYDLSIVIPALAEEFISNTVENIVKNKRGKTEVIVVLDGKWSEPGIADHPDVRIIKLGENKGQRGATNVGVKLSRAKYIAKTDAHTAFDEGFDVKLMEAVKNHDDWTIVPAMKNLHAFSWVCSNCGTEFYQGEKPDKCPDELCQFIETTWSKKIYFVPRGEMGSPKSRGPTSTAYRFTPDKLQFKYFDKLKGFQEKEGEVAETMSLQGSFFMLTRAKYWELNICDESWGGWGQQGTEVALKTWLSGGRVLCHRGTWYAHMFRTNNQVAFPWNKGLKESQGKQQQRARQACVDLFKNNKWDKQVRGLSWVVERFWEPLQIEPANTDKADRKWTKEDIVDLKKTEGRFQPKSEVTVESTTESSRGILFFTDNELPLKYARPVQKIIKEIAADKGMELVSSSRKPMVGMGKNVVTPEPRGYLTMFSQILAGLEAMTSDIVFMAEHDCLYPPEHFDYTPEKGTFAYDQNWWKIHPDGLAVHWDAEQVSGLCAYREDLIEYYRHRVATFDKDTFDRKFEPYHDNKAVTWKASVPYVDIRHGRNLTYNKRKLAHFRKKETAVNFVSATIADIPHWDKDVLSSIIK